MNKNRFCVVFNQVRGMLMAVAETVSSQHKSGGASGPANVSSKNSKNTCIALRPLAFSLLLACGQVLWLHVAHADIVADRNAPASQQPVIVNTANGISQVNIQTPSAAGVSRNTYSQFDVSARGAILNNARTSVQTQLGGFVQGNPALAAGTARVILNEVNSSNPSLLNGFVEIAGSRAQVVIANPAGISCDGCGFINANRATLTTGTPIMNSGNLLGYVVGGGNISFSGLGMDATQANFTDVIARAVLVNAGVFAQALNITAGNNRVQIDGNGNQTGITPIASSAASPGFAIDVAALGGMYAGKIHLVGTEAGVGMRNAGSIAASAGEVRITQDGQLINAGQITSSASTAIQAQSIINTNGTLVAGETLTVNAAQLSGDGRILSGGDIAITLDSDYLHTGELQANGDLSLQTSGNIYNQAELLAGGRLSLGAATLNNTGLIDASETLITAGLLDNNNASIFGDHVAIQTATLTNSNATVIAARDRLDIGAGDISNRDNSLMFSAGDLAIGGSLSADGFATSQATKLINEGSTIEALGNADIAVADLQNLNAGLVTRVAVTGTGSFDRFTPRGQGVILDSADYPGARIGDVNISSRIAGPYSFREYTRYLGSTTTRQTQLVSSLSGQILAGGDMRVAGNLLNSDSQVIAGGALDVSGANVQNLNTQGRTTISYRGDALYYDYDGSGGGFDYDIDYIGPYNPAPTVTTFNLATTALQQNVTPAGSGTSVAANTASLPATSLFRSNPDPAANYLIETDPRFADYRTWRSSDFILNALSIDPALAQKRLGDGFYEQRLVREQIGQLTGRRFLAGYVSDEAQYQALMTAAVTSADALQLVPGVALSASQVAQLTSDIVWLVARDVTLPDGTITQALLPQVYVKPNVGDLNPTTGMMAGNTVRMNVSGNLDNGGTIAGRTLVALNADNINNLGGHIAADAATLTATADINNIGGTIVAKDALLLDAGNDINLRSTTQSSRERIGASTFSRTNIDRVAGLYVSNPNAILVANAGNDANLMAASIVNSGQNGMTQIDAGNDVNLGTVSIAEQNSSVRNASNYVKHGGTKETGSVIKTMGDIAFNAGNDFNAKSAEVNSESGAIDVNAVNDINIVAGREISNFDSARKVKKSGTFSSKTKSQRDTFNADTSLSSSFSGDTVTLQSGNDINISGSNVVSDNGTTLRADNNIKIVGTQDTASEFHERKTKKSGFSASGSSISYGTQKLDTRQTSDSVSHTGSTVGSVAGDVNIVAGKNYQQTASDVIAPQGDVNIAAERVDIDAAQNTNISTQETKFKQSGLTLSISNPVIAAIQTAQQMKQAASQTSDSRMQALAAGTAALAVKNAYDLVGAGLPDQYGNVRTPGNTGADDLANVRTANAADQVGGINLSISIGSSKSSSKSTQTSSQAQGSRITAGNDINISATGAGTNSDINVIGSTIGAGNNVALSAEDQINLQAAKNTASQHSKNKSSSASVGVSFGTSGFAVTASASKGRGNADGNDVSWTESIVQSGNQVRLESGTDTNLIGAQVRGNQVIANIGKSGAGNLNIQSLQDTSTYDSKQKSAGLSISVPIGVGNFGGSLSASKSNINSDYASVVEQSGIYAGDDGFQVNVNGNTNLAGAIIASTEQAIRDNKNRLTTETLTTRDIQNSAEYEGKAISATVGGGIEQGLPTLSGAGIGSAEDKAESVTVSGISNGIVSITGNDAVTSVALLNRDVVINGNGEAVDSQGNSTANMIAPIFDAEKVANEIEAQVQITQAFGQQANYAVGTYVQIRRKHLREQFKAAAEAEKTEIQAQLDSLLLEERVMNVLIGAVTGFGGTAITKESLSIAAEEMRQITIANSKLFAGITDGTTTLNNMSGESEGVRGDGVKAGGTRIDLDLLCGTANERCVKNADGSLQLNEQNQVIFKGSLVDFLKTDEGKKAYGTTGGVQGWKGTLFGKPYTAGSWQDKLIESFSGTHDFIGGQITGLYDAQGNIKQGMTELERNTYDKWAAVAILPSTPFAAAELLPPDVWQAISILLKASK